MKRFFVSVVLAVALLSVQGVVSASIVRLTANLDGAQEVPPPPPVSTAATGFGTFDVDTVAKTVSFNVSFSGLNDGPNSVIGAHVHYGALGVNGPILWSLDTANFGTPGFITSPLSGILSAANLQPRPAVGINNIDDALSAMLSHRTYVNVHTTSRGAGEIRGQIIPEPTTVTLLLIGAAGLGATWLRKRRTK